MSKRTVLAVTAGLLIILLFSWLSSSRTVLPGFDEIWNAQLDLWSSGLAWSMLKSLALNLEALFYATVISLALAYLTVITSLRPAICFLGKLRFLPIAGLSFVFTSFATSPHELKISMLVFSICVFFITSMVDVVAEAPKEQYDLARTIGMSSWRQVWEVVILGQADKTFDALRQNAAMGWMMLTLVESTVREGGIGGILVDQTKHFRLPAMFAILIDMAIIGSLQDWGIAWVKDQLCPYAKMTSENH